MKKILILGANGFIGRNLLEYIRINNLNKLYNIVNFDINNTQSNSILQADISDRNTLNTILLNEKADYIINLIGYYKSNEYQKHYELNAGISQNICDIIIKNSLNPQKVLFIGSAAEYGNNTELPYKENSFLMPVNYYGLTKSIQAQISSYYVYNHNININIARIFNIIGPDVPSNLSIGSFISQIKSIKSGGTIEVGNTTTKRDFIHICDVVDAIWKVTIHGKHGRIYNICSNKSYSIKEILCFLIQQSGKSIHIQADQNRFKVKDIADSYGDNGRIIIDTNWKIKYPVLEQTYFI